MKQILITGGAGFIGSHLIKKLITNPSVKLICLDNFDSFYDPNIKKENINSFLKEKNFDFIEADIRQFNQWKDKIPPNIDIIIHLAAKAGVEQSLINPEAYTDVNIIGTQNMLELAKQLKCKKFIFASSSSVYGGNPNIPWTEEESTLKPISPYAATKISGELLGHVYSHLYQINFISLRFFSVYGPGQRPDLVIHKFTKLISEGKTITVYGDGTAKRDYTYIDDIIGGIVAAMEHDSRYEIINLGNNQPVELRELITMLENILDKKAIISKLPARLADAPVTFADISKAQRLLNFKPTTSLKDGISKFTEWFKKQ